MRCARNCTRTYMYTKIKILSHAKFAHVICKVFGCVKIIFHYGEFDAFTRSFGASNLVSTTTAAFLTELPLHFESAASLLWSGYHTNVVMGFISLMVNDFNSREKGGRAADARITLPHYHTTTLPRSYKFPILVSCI